MKNIKKTKQYAFSNKLYKKSVRKIVWKLIPLKKSRPAALNFIRVIISTTKIFLNKLQK